MQPITSVEAVSLPKLPASLIILGGGPVGCEFAHLFSTFGVKVMLLHKGETLLPREEPELARLVQGCAGGERRDRPGRGRGEAVRPGGPARRCVPRCGGRCRRFSAEEILVATGREAQTAGLNLPAAGRGHRARPGPDQRLPPDEPAAHLRRGRRVRPAPVHALRPLPGPGRRGQHVRRAARAGGLPGGAPRHLHRAAHRRRRPDRGAGARAGPDVRCAPIEVATLGKALVESEETGLVKLVADARSGEILGGHIAAAAAGEMIHEVVAAMAADATVRDLAEAIHAFPNFAEGVKAAAKEWLTAPVMKTVRSRPRCFSAGTGP